MSTTNQQLRKIYESQEGWTYRTIADLLGVSIDTVQGWMLADGTKRQKPMPNNQLELLQFKMERME